MRAFRLLIGLVVCILFVSALPVQAATQIHEPLPPFGDVVTFQLTPDGSRVIYMADSQISDRYELFSVPTDGSAVPVRLHEDSLPDRFLNNFYLTPDGALVIFQILREVGDRYLVSYFSIPSDGSAAATPLLLPSELSTRDFEAYRTVLTNQSLFMLITGSEPFTYDLYRIDLNGAQPVRMATFNFIYIDYVRLTADGVRLVISGIAEFSESSDTIFHVYSLPIDGSTAPIRLSLPQETQSLYDIWLTADGRYVIVPTYGSQGAQLHSIPTDGTAARLLIPANGPFLLQYTYPLILENGWLLFIAYQDSTGSGPQLYSVPVDGSAPPKPLTGSYSLFNDDSLRQFNYVLSEDGKQLFFVGLRPQTSQQAIFRVPIDGSAPVQALQSNFLFDGLYLLGIMGDTLVYGDVFLSDENVYQIRALPAEGGPSWAVTPVFGSSDEQIYEILLTEQNERILFTVGDYTSRGLYSAPLAGPETTAVLLSPSEAANGSVNTFIIRGDTVVMRGDLRETGVQELFHSPLSVPGLGFDHMQVVVRESEPFTLTVTLDAPLNDPVTADYEVLDDEGNRVRNGSLSIPAAATSVDINLTLSDDVESGFARNYSVQLSNIVGVAPRISARIELQVLDDDLRLIWLPDLSRQ